MGAFYSTYLKATLKDEKGAVKALQTRIAKAKEDNTNYHTEENDTTTLRGLLDILFAAHQEDTEVMVKSNHWEYQSWFSASYGWEQVLHLWFEDLAPFLEDGSYLEIEPDSGRYYLVAEGGVVKEKDNL